MKTLLVHLGLGAAAGMFARPYLAAILTALIAKLTAVKAKV